MLGSVLFVPLGKIWADELRKRVGIYVLDRRHYILEKKNSTAVCIHNTSSILHVMKKKLKQTLYESNLKLFSFLLFYNVKKVGSFAGTVGSCMYVVTISFGK